MSTRLKYVLSAIGAGVLATSAITAAFASHPVGFRGQVKSQSRTTTVSGNLTVTNVAHINKNESVYGRLYAHGGEQVWKALTVKSGGLSVSGGTNTDSLNVGTTLAADSATIAHNLSAGNISGAGLSLTGGATVGGKLTANGVDAGAGGITTAGSITASGLSVSGNVNFANATVTGLNLSNINLTNAALQTLNLGNPSSTSAPLNLSENGQTEQLGVDSTGALTVRSANIGAGTFGTLNLGTTSDTTSGLTLNENGKSLQLGVDANGNLTVGGGLAFSGPLSTSNALSVAGNATVNGSLTVGNSVGVIASNLQAPNPSGSTSPGALTLQGSTIALTGSTTANGNLTLSGASDLNLSAPATSGTVTSNSHIVANGATDVAGTLAIGVGTSGEATATQCFRKAYGTAPIVTITATSDPAPAADFAASANGAPKVWVTTVAQSFGGCANGGFTIHYVPPAAVTSSFTVSYAYHVVGS